MKKFQGFGILEAVLAVALLGVALAGIVPVFVNYANANKNAEVRTGAVTVAERLLDELRQRPFASWNAFRTDVAKTKIETGLRAYDATIVWDTPDLTLGNGSEIRHVRVEVFFSGERYYSVETVFTQFD